MKKGSYSKIIVALVIILNVAFASAVLVTFWHTGAEPKTLIISWFTFTGSELLTVAGIRIAKIKRKEECSNEDANG